MYEIKKNGCQNSIKKNISQTSLDSLMDYISAKEKVFIWHLHHPCCILLLLQVLWGQHRHSGRESDVESSDLNLHSTNGFKNRRETSSKNIQSVTFWKSLFQPSLVGKCFLLISNHFNNVPIYENLIKDSYKLKSD